MLVLYQGLSYSIPYDNNELVNIAKKYVGTIEIGKNRGIFQDSVNKYVGNTLGSPYCMAFVMYCIEQIKPNIYKKTGLATAFKGKRLIKAIDVWNNKEQVKKGYVIIWQKGTSIYGHAGIATENWNGIEGQTIQANTTMNKKQGIFIKKAKIEPYNYFRIIRFWEI